MSRMLREEVRYMIESPCSQGLSQKVLCISHVGDVDGCVSAALIKHATKSSFLLTDYGSMNTSLKSILPNYNLVYVCDLGINETAIEEFSRIRRFAELTYIDHHPLDRDISEALQKIGVKIAHDLRECASVLTFNLFKETLPREAGLLASYAAISDRMESGPLAKKILRRYDRDFVLFEAMLLSYALERSDTDFKKKIVCQLSSLEHPHQIKGLSQLALEQADRIAALRKELPKRASKLGNIVYVEARGGSSGAIANLLLDVCDATIGISYETNRQKQISDLSIRGRTSLKIDLGKITYQLAKKLEGFGGGHPKASGARIPTSKLMEFIQSLNDQN